MKEGKLSTRKYIWRKKKFSSLWKTILITAHYLFHKAWVKKQVFAFEKQVNQVVDDTAASCAYLINRKLSINFKKKVCFPWQVREVEQRLRLFLPSPASQPLVKKGLSIQQTKWCLTQTEYYVTKTNLKPSIQNIYRFFLHASRFSSPNNCLANRFDVH